MAGLTSLEAKSCSTLHGPNELAHEGSRRILQIFAEVPSKPMRLILLASGLICIAFGAAIQ